MRNFLEAVEASGKEKTKPYDTAATVTRIEGKTAWVHIDGGVDETPVQLTIDAKVGDTVKVRVSGGQAWLQGNSTAPPTDDTVAHESAKTATDFLQGGGSEIFLHPKNDTTNGVLIKDAVEIIRQGKTVAKYGDKTVIGEQGAVRVEIESNRFTMYNGTNVMFRVDLSYPRTARGIVYHIGDGVVSSYEDGEIIDWQGGASDAEVYPYFTKYDSVAQLRLDVKSSTSIAAGGNIFEGEFSGNGFTPLVYTTGVGYYGSHVIVGRITPAGKIVIRNASPSAVTVSDTVTISFTYILA